MARDSFILYTEQKEVIDKLSNEQAGKLIKAIYEYVETNEMPKLDNILELVIIPFKQNIDRNTDKWEEIKKKRSEAGKIGAETKKQKQAKQANAKFALSKQANQAVNVNVNDNVNVNVNDNNNNKVSDSCVDGSQVDDSCVDGLRRIIDFYNNNIGAITPHGLEILQDYLKEFNADIIIYALQISVEANKRNIQYIKAILNNWSKAGVKTLVEAQNESKKKAVITKKKDGNFTDRDYSGFDFNTLLANKEFLKESDSK